MQSEDSFDVLAWFKGGYANPAASAISSELWFGSTACLIILSVFRSKTAGNEA